MNITPRTKLIGLIGHPVEHSLSPQLHNALYREYGLDYIYVAFDIAPGDVAQAAAAFRTLSFVGFNVTIPHKQSIIPFLDALEYEARAIGSVNTVRIQDGKLFGYNTDGMGFVDSLKRRGIELGGKRVLVLGAGGSARAICVYLLKERIDGLYILNRTRGRAVELINSLASFFPAAYLHCIDNEDLEGLKPDLIINTTPLGMWPDVESDPLESYDFSPGTIVVDIIYNPPETLFLRRAREAGCVTVNGLDMLIGQALKAIEIWTGVVMDYDRAVDLVIKNKKG
ncbi:MAG: shikimate dehydrogenase [Clostridiales bacterium]|jgi:shikimate dehydrogenase|nr:shikimate dehydrogenase [Clostridiales bacterium]